MPVKIPSLPLLLFENIYITGSNMEGLSYVMIIVHFSHFPTFDQVFVFFFGFSAISGYLHLSAILVNSKVLCYR